MCAVVLITCIILKIVYFIRAGKTSRLKFAISFFKRYNIYQMMNAPGLTKDYMKLNNKLNSIIWFCSLVLIGTYLLVRKITGQ